MPTTIDLNCDMGESFGAWSMGADEAVMPWVSSANIACGFHAGDPVTMLATVKAAEEAGVAIGAHVGLPDLLGFGRRAMAIDPQELYAMTVVQIGALQAVARTVGTSVSHVKPHGALYHMLETDRSLAGALVAAVSDLDRGLTVFGRAGGSLLQVAAAAGLGVAHEAFADRRYGSDGRLVPRRSEGALIDDVATAVHQAVALALHGEVDSHQGGRLKVSADSLCVHGDRADAEAFARGLHEGLQAAGVTIRAIAAAR